MKQLKQLIVKLNNDELCAVDIYDNDLEKYVHRNFIHSKIAEQYENAENFFDSLLNDGHERLTVQEKRKSGNSFKYVGKEFKIEPEETEVKTKTTLEMEKIKPKKKKKKKKNSTGLGYGLSMPEQIDLHTRASKLEEVKEELKEYKAECKNLKIENERLKEEALQRKYTRENNDSRNKMLMTAVKELPGILNGIGFKIPASQSGLAGSAVQDIDFEEFTESQTKLIETIKQGDESTNEIMLALFDKILEADDTFSQQFYNFLVIHKIVNNGN